ncbi:WxL domain-containing protein [Enterococcus casseliflavus]|uniref:WxL domain-containing protein n=1 Tax=Enterococcus casseliflavus TaxID=37734 RepID=UPI00232EBBAC|nr:WxL domain-containing protein [Enterococcus casseliflavus]MDB1689568.1 WxL domain-containing protein [Enterococcus casseliflavus]
MTTRFRRPMLVLGTTILIIQSVFMPVGMVYAETSIDTEEQKPVELPDFENSLEELTSAPNFFFPQSQLQGTTEEPLQVTFVSDQEVSEARVFIPEEATIINEQLSAGVSVVQGDQPQEWLVQSEQPQNTFVLTLIFDIAGNYVVSIHEEKVNIGIQSLETLLPDEHIDNNLDQNETYEAEESLKDKKLDPANQIDSEKLVSYSLSSEGVAEVTNWTEFGQALGTPSITTIEVTDDFEVPTNSTVPGFVTGVASNPSGAAQFVYLTPANSSRKLVVNGNGHHIDFGSVSIVPMPATHNEQSPWDITFNDATIYSGNWWGFWSVQQGLTLAQQQISKIALKDVSFVGNQMLAPYYTHVDLYGKIDNYIVASYNSPFRTNFAVNTPNSINIESRSLTIKEDAVVNFSTLNSGNIVIGVGGVSGSLILEKNATLNIESNGTAESANANAQTGSSIDIANGDLIMNEGSAINIDTNRSFAAISLRSSNSSLEIIDGAKLNISSNNYAYTNNGVNRNLVSMSTGSSIIVGSEGELKVNAEGQGNASANIFHVAGAANFTISKDGLLDIKSDSTSTSQSLLSFTSAGSTFQFSDAKRVNLERTGTINGTTAVNGLINIAGSTGLLDINVQSVKQWVRGNFEVKPDHSWNPIFNLNLRYTGVVPRIETVSSISQETADNFKQNFTTQNVQRILFEKIPDVEVMIDPLTEDPNEVNSHTITGRANPNSVIRFSGDPAIPTGSITSPDISESEKYHTTADENGDYHYELPEGLRFTAGNTVTAYAFLNGKNDNASTIVEEKIMVLPVDPLDPETEVSPENKPELPEDQGQLSIDFISSFYFGSQAISVNDQTYYAKPQRLLNEDGTVNESEERPNYVQISDRRSENERNGWELAVTQKEQFTGEENQVLNGASLSLSNQQVITAQGGTAPGLQSIPCDLVPGNRRTLLKAQGNEGTGTWIYRFGDGETAGESVALDIPRGSNPEATTYSSTLIWELSAVPDN